MSDNSDRERKRSLEEDGKHTEDDPNVGEKRPRGPADCLDWDESEEEFTPFTQERIFTPRVQEPVFAKKSSAKRSKKGKSKGNGSKCKSSSKKSGNALVCN